MNNYYIALAVPFFFLLIGVELLIARARGRARVYRFADAITDLSCGITSQVTVIFYGALLLSVYIWIYHHYRLTTFTVGWVPWAIAFIGVDFFYYWWHRLSHEVNVLWAAHVVHHQSEDYNLAVALRQAVATSWTGMPFYLPLALAGVPPLVYSTMLAFSTLYQFWIHTELVGKARGPVDWILNLPSHHRVHHAINPQYLDKNYGAILIVWDRLFGTYEEEIEPPIYGITKPLNSLNPMWAQVHYWVELARVTVAAPRLGDKLRVWFASPAWQAEGLPPPPPRAVPYDKYHPRSSSRTKTYVFINYVVLSAATFCLMMWSSLLPKWLDGAVAACIVAGLISIGALLESKRWALPAELARLILSAAVGAAILFHHFAH